MTRFYDRLNKRMPYKFRFFKKKRLNVQKIKNSFSLQQSSANYITLLRKNNIKAKRRFFKLMKKMQIKKNQYNYMLKNNNLALKFLFKYNKNKFNTIKKTRRYFFKKFPLIKIYEFTKEYFQHVKSLKENTMKANRIQNKQLNSSKVFSNYMFDYTYPYFFSILYSLYFFPLKKATKNKTQSIFYKYYHKLDILAKYRKFSFMKKKSKTKLSSLIFTFTPIFLFILFNFIESIQLIEFAKLTYEIYSQQYINTTSPNLLSQLSLFFHPSFHFRPFFKKLSFFSKRTKGTIEQSNNETMETKIEKPKKTVINKRQKRGKKQKKIHLQTTKKINKTPAIKYQKKQALKRDIFINKATKEQKIKKTNEQISTINQKNHLFKKIIQNNRRSFCFVTAYMSKNEKDNEIKETKTKIKIFNEQKNIKNQQKYNENKIKFQKIFNNIKKNNPLYFSKRGIKIKYNPTMKEIKVKIRTKKSINKRKKNKTPSPSNLNSNFYMTDYFKMRHTNYHENLPLENKEVNPKNKKINKGKIINIKSHNNNIIENAINHKNVKYVYDNLIDDESYNFYSDSEYDIFGPSIKDSIFNALLEPTQEELEQEKLLHDSIKPDADFMKYIENKKMNATKVSNNVQKPKQQNKNLTKKSNSPIPLQNKDKIIKKSTKLGVNKQFNNRRYFCSSTPNQNIEQTLKNENQEIINLKQELINLHQELYNQQRELGYIEFAIQRIHRSSFPKDLKAFPKRDNLPELWGQRAYKIREITAIKEEIAKKILEYKEMLKSFPTNPSDFPWDLPTSLTRKGVEIVFENGKIGIRIPIIDSFDILSVFFENFFLNSFFFLLCFSIFVYLCNTNFNSSLVKDTLLEQNNINLKPNKKSKKKIKNPIDKRHYSTLFKAENSKYQNPPPNNNAGAKIKKGRNIYKKENINNKSGSKLKTEENQVTESKPIKTASKYRKKIKRRKKKIKIKKEKISYHRLNPFQKIKREAQYTLKDILTYNRIEAYRVPKYRGYRNKLALPYIRYYRVKKSLYAKQYIKFLPNQVAESKPIRLRKNQLYKKKALKYKTNLDIKNHEFIKKMGKKVRLKNPLIFNTKHKIQKKIATMIKAIKTIKWRFLGNDLYYESVSNTSRKLLKNKNYKRRAMQ